MGQGLKEVGVGDEGGTYNLEESMQMTLAKVQTQRGLWEESDRYEEGEIISPASPDTR